MRFFDWMTTALVAGFMLTTAHGYFFSELNQKALMRDATVQIADYCSGVVIPDPKPEDGIQGTVLSAGHCSEKVGDVVVINVPVYENNVRVRDEPYKAMVYKRLMDDKSGVDLTWFIIIDSKPFNIKGVKVYAGDAAYGERAFLVGYPRMLGEFISGATLGPLVSNFQVGVTTLAPGSSGGGLYRIGYFGPELVGITSMSFNNDFESHSNYGFFVSTQNIREFLID